MSQVVLLLPGAPEPPTDQERELYYYGLPSCPKLVARSSEHIWVNKSRYKHNACHDSNLKALQPVGRHPLLHRLWNDASSSLRVRILQAVSVANWTAIDILRVCINREGPITLMVAVSPGSLSWSDGHAIAMQCKSILEAHGIYGVHCEIRESVVTFCTGEKSETNSTTDSTTDSSVDSSTDSENETSSPTAFRLFSEPMPKDEHVTGYMWAKFSDALGTNIAMKHRNTCAGTKGLYLSLLSSPGAEPKILALTCRHVVMDSKTEGLEAYCRPESAPFKDVIQVDQPNYEYMVRLLDGGLSIYHKSPKHFDSALPCSFSAKSAFSLLQAITPFNAASSRVFGQLLYSPGLNTSATGSGAQWSRDWALIELLPGSHQSPLSLIKNKVDIGSAVDFVCLVFASKRVAIDIELEDGCQTMKSTVVPIDQIFKSDCTAEDEPMMVMKYGLRGVFTLGLGNTLKSIVRHPEAPGGVKRESEEWPIVSVAPDRERFQDNFSTGGDSGACVWDTKQRPAGMITAGSSFFRQVYDVTYAQPLEAILADIKSCGYEVSLV